jgi:hypothetical protein
MGQSNSVMMLKTRLLLQKNQREAVRGQDYVHYEDLAPEQQKVVRNYYAVMFERFQCDVADKPANLAALHFFIYGHDFHMTSYVLGNDVKCCTTVWTPINTLLEFIPSDGACVIERNSFPKRKSLSHVYQDKYYKCTGILNIRLSDKACRSQ